MWTIIAQFIASFRPPSVMESAIRRSMSDPGGYVDSEEGLSSRNGQLSTVSGSQMGRTYRARKLSAWSTAFTTC